MHRIKDPYHAQTAAAFIDWGIPTVESLRNAREISKEWLVFASGGLRTGIDVAKCLALGANLGGMAAPFLKAAHQSLETTVNTMQMIVDQVRIAMFACGAHSIAELTQDKLTEVK